VTSISSAFVKYTYPISINTSLCGRVLGTCTHLELRTTILLSLWTIVLFCLGACTFSISSSYLSNLHFSFSFSNLSNYTTMDERTACSFYVKWTMNCWMRYLHFIWILKCMCVCNLQVSQ